jgi:general secretion pathway protein K
MRTNSQQGPGIRGQGPGAGGRRASGADLQVCAGPPGPSSGADFEGGRPTWTSAADLEVCPTCSRDARGANTGHRKGAALLTVLWLSAALAAIAMSLSLTVRGETERAGVATDGLRCRYLATGAVERASVELIWAAMYPSVRQLQIQGSSISYTFPSGTVRVEIIPEASKLNVNFASADELYRLATALGVDPGRAGEIAQGIANWNDPGAAAYPSPIPSFQRPRASFQEIEELLLVRGVTPDIFYGTYLPAEGRGGPRLVRRYGLVDCLSVYGARDRVDVNSANPAVLAAVGVSPGGVGSLVAQRRQGQISAGQLPSLIESAGAPGDRLRAGGGSIYTLRATARLQGADGRVSDVSRTVAALVKYMPVQPPIHILRWYDSVWSN